MLRFLGRRQNPSMRQRRRSMIELMDILCDTVCKYQTLNYLIVAVWDGCTFNWSAQRGEVWTAQSCRRWSHQRLISHRWNTTRQWTQLHRLQHNGTNIRCNRTGCPEGGLLLPDWGLDGALPDCKTVIGVGKRGISLDSGVDVLSWSKTHNFPFTFDRQWVNSGARLWTGDVALLRIQFCICPRTKFSSDSCSFLWRKEKWIGTGQRRFTHLDKSPLTNNNFFTKRL